jgi:hypothetical protein
LRSGGLHLPVMLMTGAKYKRWLINIVIVVVVTALMVALAEVAMRWYDGFQLTTLELQKDPNNTHK